MRCSPLADLFTSPQGRQCPILVHGRVAKLLSCRDLWQQCAIPSSNASVPKGRRNVGKLIRRCQTRGKRPQPCHAQADIADIQRPTLAWSNPVRPINFMHFMVKQNMPVYALGELRNLQAICWGPPSVHTCGIAGPNLCLGESAGGSTNAHRPVPTCHAVDQGSGVLCWRHGMRVHAQGHLLGACHSHQGGVWAVAPADGRSAERSSGGLHLGAGERCRDLTCVPGKPRRSQYLCVRLGAMHTMQMQLLSLALSYVSCESCQS